MTSKEIVLGALAFQNPPRAPRQLWTLPWAERTYPAELAEIRQRFPDDIVGCPAFLRETSPVARGDMYAVGSSIDEWGCRFTNLHQGVIGEAKEPIVIGEEWEDVGNVRLPVECLSVDRAEVNRFCATHRERFITAGCCPRPFERLQFIRGTEQLYVDLMLRPEGLLRFIQEMHKLYCEELLLWAKTDVDALTFMDDWGAQRSMLINPSIWKELFQPLYRDYIEIAHSHGKKAFMHSDGYILDIYPPLVGMGLDAINSQIFCMGAENLAPFRGQITFWGEMDRQHLLVHGTPDEVRRAVWQVKEQLWADGGCIAQCEFGPGAKPENVAAVFEGWAEAAQG